MLSFEFRLVQRSIFDANICFVYIQINREGVLLLRGLDSRLSKDLPSDLQKLRCKVFENIFCYLTLKYKC